MNINEVKYDYDMFYYVVDVMFVHYGSFWSHLCEHFI